MSRLEERIDSLEKRPPLETRTTEVKEIYKSMSENMGLQLGAGLSSSPFGGIPVVTGAITWKRFVSVEGIVGHTFWDNSYRFEGADLSTRRRIAGGLVTVYPLSKIPVGVAGGWLRIEEISQRYNEYVRMSEGPVIGLRVTPLDYLSITAVQNNRRSRIQVEKRSVCNIRDRSFFIRRREMRKIIILFLWLITCAGFLYTSGYRPDNRSRPGYGIHIRYPI
jgi:hypothetical protein